LAGVSNPLVWNVNTNAIYINRCLVYFEVFQTELHAHLVVLNDHPTSLPPAFVMRLAHALRPTTEPGAGFADAAHALSRTDATGSGPERKLWRAGGAWWGVLWSDARAAWSIQRLDVVTQTWSDVGPAVATSPALGFDVLAEGDTVSVASNVA